MPYKPRLLSVFGCVLKNSTSDSEILEKRQQSSDVEPLNAVVLNVILFFPETDPFIIDRCLTDKRVVVNVKLSGVGLNSDQEIDLSFEINTRLSLRDYFTDEHLQPFIDNCQADND